GFRAIIAESYAEIFFGNSTTLGMPCLSASREDIESLGVAIEQAPATEVTIDLEAMTVTFGETTFPITMPESARQALTAGRWDPIQELLDSEERINAVGKTLPYV
ncbi:MAG: isopropylmalate isomerase, partial [Roseibacillus sp.]|nr:isopropylmalate isomerase [Roseibacillus sp.]